MLTNSRVETKTKQQKINHSHRQRLLFGGGIFYFRSFGVLLVEIVVILLALRTFEPSAAELQPQLPNGKTSKVALDYHSVPFFYSIDRSTTPESSSNEPCKQSVVNVSDGYDHRFFFGYDFFYFLAAAKLFWSGNNPYSLCNYKSQLSQQGWTSTYELLPFPYPPNFLMLLGPLTPFSFELALFLWSLILIYALIAVALKLREVAWDRYSVLWALMLVLSFPATTRLIAYGQVSLPIVGLWLGVLNLRGKNDFQSGVLGSISLVKPHFAVIPLLGFVLQDLSCKRFLWIIGLCFGISMQAGFCYYFNPTATLGFLGAVQDIFSSHNDLMLRLSSHSILSGDYVIGASQVLTICSLISGTLVALSRRMSETMRVSLLLLLAVIFTPYLWLHDFFLAIPAIFLFVKNLNMHPRVFVAGFSVLFVANRGFITPSPDESLSKIFFVLLFIYLLLSNKIKVSSNE